MGLWLMELYFYGLFTENGRFSQDIRPIYFHAACMVSPLVEFILQAINMTIGD